MRMCDMFVKFEIFKTLAKFLSYLIFVLFWGNVFLKNNNRLNLLKQHPNENKSIIKKYSMFLAVDIFIMIFSVFKIIKKIMYLLECLLNPKYVILNHFLKFF